MNSLLTKKSIFGSGKFYIEVLAIAIPVMLQQLIQTLVSLVDNFMVAGLGDTSMAAVNVSNQVNFIYLVMVMALANCGGVFMSQFSGAKDADGMKHTYRFKVIMLLLLSSIYFVLCQFMPESLIKMMTNGNSSQEEIIVQGSAYMKLVSWYFLPYAISVSISSSFREIRKPKVSLTISVIATLINTFLNWVLIYGHLGAPRLEIAGAAIATIIARVCETVIFILYARKTKVSFFVPLYSVFKVKLSLFVEIFKKSVLMLISETTWVISETVITALYNGRGGAEVVAGMSAGWSIVNIFFISFSGISTATFVIVGGLLGQNKLEEARQKARWILYGSFLIGFVIALLQCTSVFLVPLIYHNLSVAATKVTTTLLLVAAIYMPSWTLINAQFAVARSGGDMMMGIVVDVAITYLVFIPGAFLLANFTNVGPVAMYGIIKITDVGKNFIAAKWLKRELWLKNLAIHNQID